MLNYSFNVQSRNKLMNTKEGYKITVKCALTFSAKSRTN